MFRWIMERNRSSALKTQPCSQFPNQSSGLLSQCILRCDRGCRPQCGAVKRRPRRADLSVAIRCGMGGKCRGHVAAAPRAYIQVQLHHGRVQRYTTAESRIYLVCRTALVVNCDSELPHAILPTSGGCCAHIRPSLLRCRRCPLHL